MEHIQLIMEHLKKCPDDKIGLELVTGLQKCQINFIMEKLVDMKMVKAERKEDGFVKWSCTDDDFCHFPYEKPIRNSYYSILIGLDIVKSENLAHHLHLDVAQPFSATFFNPNINPNLIEDIQCAKVFSYKCANPWESQMIPCMILELWSQSTAKKDKKMQFFIVCENTEPFECLKSFLPPEHSIIFAQDWSKLKYYLY